MHRKTACRCLSVAFVSSSSLTGFFLNAPNKTLEKQAKDYEEKHGAGSYGEKYAAMVKKWWDKAVWARSHAGGPKRAHM